MTSSDKPKAHLGLQIGLWTAQAIVAALFLSGAAMKLLVPLPKLALMMPWTGQVSPALVTFTGVVDLLGGVGILAPALTRIQPRLTVYAAIGCFVLQTLALIFHLSRGEGATMAPMNVFLGLLSAFVVWGRAVAAPIAPR